MKKFEKVTNQNYKIVELWYSESGETYFAIIKKHNDYAWGSHYYLDKGYWGQGHYDFKTLQEARQNMLDIYRPWKPDLYKKFNIKEVN